MRADAEQLRQDEVGQDAGDLRIVSTAKLERE